ncbi:MAG: phage holin family protein [Flavobacteriales bacterium]|nr:phage holin family protein [Flavobacteriales bacterium]MCB9447975.1 phage holin family protein [Flavobacteriales bacterium]
MIGRILLSSLAVAIAAYLMPGVHVESVGIALVVAIVLGLLNAFVKPILILLTLPITVFTLGFFLLVLNALMVMLASRWVDGFYVSGFWTALLFSLLLSFINALLGVNKQERRRESR